MLAAGEIDVAVDELRWLLQGCGTLVEAHKLLGDIALDDGDVELARSHFGRVYQLGLDALPRGGLRGTLPGTKPANRVFFEAGRKLAECLRRLDNPDLAEEVLATLQKLDPLGLRPEPGQ